MSIDLENMTAILREDQSQVFQLKDASQNIRHRSSDSSRYSYSNLNVHELMFANESRPKTESGLLNSAAAPSVLEPACAFNSVARKKTKKIYSG